MKPATRSLLHSTRLGKAAAFAAFLLLPLPASTGAAAPAPATTDIAMWDLSDLYASPEAWAQEYDRLKAQAQQLDLYKGTLGSSAIDMERAMDAISAVRKESSRLYSYASLKADEDLSIARNQECRQQ